MGAFYHFSPYEFLDYFTISINCSLYICVCVYVCVCVCVCVLREPHCFYVPANKHREVITDIVLKVEEQVILIKKINIRKLCLSDHSLALI